MKRKVLEKVVKLLKLAQDRAAAPGESKNAHVAAQALVTKHGITREDLEGFIRPKPRPMPAGHGWTVVQYRWSDYSGPNSTTANDGGFSCTYTVYS